MEQKQGTEKRIERGPLRAAYMLWKAGYDLREIYPTRTYWRHKRFLLEKFQVNIDISPTV